MTSILQTWHLMALNASEEPSLPPSFDPKNQSQRVMTTQLILAAAAGLTAFLTFCVVRTRWNDIYAPRVRSRPGLPVLSSSMFGWIVPFLRISDDQILDHCGLDAYVFLGFFKMSMQLLGVCLFFGVTVISPIRLAFTGDYDYDNPHTNSSLSLDFTSRSASHHYQIDPTTPDIPPNSYLWTYVIFVYVFTFISTYFLRLQTLKVVRLRQKYLGLQNSITDRTIRFAGIPKHLQDEENLAAHIKSLGIGGVQSVTICRNWDELDKLVMKHEKVVRKLESAWATYIRRARSLQITPNMNSNINLDTPINLDENSDPLDTGANAQENSPLLDDADLLDPYTEDHSSTLRPKIRIGFCGLSGRKVDAIDYYTDRLEDIERRIHAARQKAYKSTGNSFVTMSDVASAQMVSQAVLDPKPHRLVAYLAPSPSDIIWKNIYMGRAERLIRTWSITVIIAVLSIAFVVPVSYLATFLNYKPIAKVWPALGRLLKNSPPLMFFVTGLLPPVIFTLLNVSIPYLYDYLSSLQGFVSRSDVELSVITKNFFFIFVNLFVVFTIAGTASNYWSFIKDTTKIAYLLASSLRELSLFYGDLIILQGLAMFPFRLLQIGSVLKFPIAWAKAKTTRDYIEMTKPPNFNYGLMLPQPILILVICLIYSVMSTKILACGLMYFVLGYITYKYQLLYSMEHVHHSTGRAWPIIFYRVSAGLLLFQLTMVGVLALHEAYFLATLLAFAPVITAGFILNFYRNYSPLCFFIALKSIHRRVRPRASSWTLDEEREKHQLFVNPSLIKPLEKPIITLNPRLPSGSTVHEYTISR
ncbi:hypothetical protein CANCADRAFT_83469 [Tortispora caseinolytica NRRL Y-17796]|uniref:CSC1/OSCA1-like 7TM region domain-containing protein n=1 Tax=Tortispora caseinolytica NRRL Y-17796 TaxID=767744 RepID=A0A1E4TK85_9ASCO|nr:hypothetical protein CANCADRAFT_83469 [Tortispora caseinolytica NRRL Y-17796]